MNSNIIFWPSNELEYVHLLIWLNSNTWILPSNEQTSNIKLKRPSTLVSIAQKIFSKKFELAVSKVRLKSNLDDNTIQSEKKSWEKVENREIWTHGHTHHPLKLPRFTTVRQRKIELSNFRGILWNFWLYPLLTYQWTY